MSKSDDAWLSAAECAARTGLTVRALRVYEREGLLSPARTAKGWRRYGPRELERLNTIVILKALGLTLAQIRALVTEAPPSLRRILEVQAESWGVKLAAAKQALAMVEAARQRLNAKQELSIHELCELIKSIDIDRSPAMQTDASPLQALIKELIPEEEQRAWSAWWATHPADTAQNLAYVRARTELFGQVQGLIDKGEPPSSAAAQAFLGQHEVLLSQYGARERIVRLLDWNASTTEKWMRIGAEARARHPETERFPHPLVPRSLHNYFHAAIKASAVARSALEIVRDTRKLIDAHADPASPDADDVLERLNQLCAAHSLGSPYVYARFAPFIARINDVEVTSEAQAAWDFLARAADARGAEAPGANATCSEASDSSEHETQPADLAVVRRAYAKQITALVGVNEPRIEAAFAAVPREHFLGPGPWPLLSLMLGSYVLTPDADPVRVYVNSVVAILPEKRLNNGEPALHARLFAEALPDRGDHVVHIGAGLGYYSAIMAHLVGSSGRVTAIEREPELADRAREKLAATPNVSVIQGDGAQVGFDSANVIYVSAGATRPADAWLDRLTEGGRLILPLTTNKWMGAVFRITRQGADYFASWVSPIGIYPCLGSRDEESEQALAAALANGQAKSVTRLYRNDLPPDERCWLRGPGWCLAYS
jgi:protein-L-isoaspartate(D-aspartate) O-methyltransferase